MLAALKTPTQSALFGAKDDKPVGGRSRAGKRRPWPKEFVTRRLVAMVAAGLTELHLQGVTVDFCVGRQLQRSPMASAQAARPLYASIVYL